MTKSLLISLFFVVAGSAGVAASEYVQIATGVAVFDHSGGCRKSSPAGQCCHAGSQPLHCH